MRWNTQSWKKDSCSWEATNFPENRVLMRESRNLFLEWERCCGVGSDQQESWGRLSGWSSKMASFSHRGEEGSFCACKILIINIHLQRQNLFVSGNLADLNRVKVARTYEWFFCFYDGCLYLLFSLIVIGIWL